MYGIIAAMQEEMKEIKKIMQNIENKEIYELNFFKGTISDKNVVLVEAGVGKVNAARVTQILIDNFKVEGIINVGSAGSCNDELEIGDIVIGKKLVQHDESNEQLIVKIEETIKRIKDKDFKIKVGTIASGDIFCTESKMKEKIRNKFNADCIEMEGSAIAQVCKLDKIPFLVVRSISDKPNGQNEITFDKFLEKASRRCAYIINEFFTHQ